MSDDDEEEKRKREDGESRWQAIVAIIIVLAILEALPGRLRIMPAWFPLVAAALLVAPMIGIALAHSPVFVRLERAIIFLFVMFSIVLMLLSLERLIKAIISPEQTTGANYLLASALEIWVLNVVAFGLLYWQLDRGGPEVRRSDHPKPPEILFPERTGEDWSHSFIDYLFYAYTVSTAFSPAEMFPHTARMKVLMMVQSTISLATILIVASRAINILK